MAHREMEPGEVVHLALATPAPETDEEPGARRRDVQKVTEKARRVEAMSLRLAGFTIEQIADRLGVDSERVRVMISHALETATNQNAEEMREVENARLDRAQSAIWSKVLDGNLSAVETFLKISKQRAALNGLNAPTKVALAVNIRQEMEQALGHLEAMVVQTAIDHVQDAEIEEDA